MPLARLGPVTECGVSGHGGVNDLLAVGPAGHGLSLHSSVETISAESRFFRNWTVRLVCCRTQMNEGGAVADAGFIRFGELEVLPGIHED